ncbi:hypothetical protein [Streptomyces purpurogeneiscleroticus]|uniref:hypothetical protein n=1 Tax=Streptomyces purpurogeneiscleroticus TaxID=68259 RepID=UPI001CBCD321|nr:hypothetical protein [Streptomyces purpurogeneiscleroticus]MBZ4015954.1 hypothetical protein [Streptomyces purpurogeneiscleroticus]
MSAPTDTASGRREPGELFGPRFELFADVLALGLVTAVACLPLVTVPAALATACTLLRRRQRYAEPCTAGHYVRALCARRWRADLAAGGLLLAFGVLFAADTALAAAGLPGAVPFALFLAAVGTVLAVIALRACAQEQAAGHWRAALRAAALCSARDLPGSLLVLLALATAAVCAWVLPPLLFLVPGPLAVALTAVERRTDG